MSAFSLKKILRNGFGVEWGKFSTCAVFRDFFLLSTDPLALCAGAGTGKPKIACPAQGSKVQCYGYYTEADDAKWLLVAAGAQTGFAHSGYLKKV
ncbi:MAG TPA: hypothetical protein DF613_02090 [Lachnospiraceae bacterium]|nr:hypothetical protein [Lachnospiraceae bacterium]